MREFGGNLTLQKRCDEVNKIRKEKGLTLWPRYLKVEERAEFEKSGSATPQAMSAEARPASPSPDPRVRRRNVAAHRAKADDMVRTLLSEAVTGQPLTDAHVESVLNE